MGIGLERIAWLANGSSTSYSDTFANAMAYLLPKLEVKYDEAIWEKFGPISCTLNVDEVENIDATWNDIAAKIGEPVEVVK